MSHCPLSWRDIICHLTSLEIVSESMAQTPPPSPRQTHTHPSCCSSMLHRQKLESFPCCIEGWEGGGGVQSTCLSNPAERCGLGKHRDSPLKVPAQDNLPRSLPQLLGDFHNFRPLHYAGGAGDLASKGAALCNYEMSAPCFINKCNYQCPGEWKCSV